MKEAKIQYLLTQVEVLEFGYQVGHWETPTTFDEWFVRVWFSQNDKQLNRLFSMFLLCEESPVGWFISS